MRGVCPPVYPSVEPQSVVSRQPHAHTGHTWSGLTAAGLNSPAAPLTATVVGCAARVPRVRRAACSLQPLTGGTRVRATRPRQGRQPAASRASGWRYERTGTSQGGVVRVCVESTAVACAGSRSRGTRQWTLAKEGAPARAAQSGAPQRRGAATDDDLYGVPRQPWNALSACCGRRSSGTDANVGRRRGSASTAIRVVRGVGWMCDRLNELMWLSWRHAVFWPACERLGTLCLLGGVEPQRRRAPLPGGAVKKSENFKCGWADTERVRGGDRRVRWWRLLSQWRLPFCCRRH